jgi:hypothetical protein
VHATQPETEYFIDEEEREVRRSSRREEQRELREEQRHRKSGSGVFGFGSGSSGGVVRSSWAQKSREEEWEEREDERERRFGQMVQLVKESEKLIRQQGGGAHIAGAPSGHDDAREQGREREWAEAMASKERQFAEAMERRERRYEEMLHSEHSAHQQVIERLLQHQEAAHRKEAEKKVEQEAEQEAEQEQVSGREERGGGEGTGERAEVERQRGRREKEQWLEVALTKGLEHAQKQQRLQQWGEDEGGWRSKRHTLNALHSAWSSSRTNARRQKQLLEGLHKLLGDQTLFLRWLFPYLALKKGALGKGAAGGEIDSVDSVIAKDSDSQSRQQQLAMAKGMCSRLERGAKVALLAMNSIDEYAKEMDSATAAVEAAAAAVGAALSATTSSAVATEVMAVAILWRGAEHPEQRVEPDQRTAQSMLSCLPEE